MEGNCNVVVAMHVTPLLVTTSPAGPWILIDLV